jgi:predicted nuclease of restriction endonuclease-like (RecB) superfamily
MTVEATKVAIKHLKEPERRELADWIEQFEEQAWDAEMEQDLSSGGRGHHLVEKINREIDDCNFTPM